MEIATYHKLCKQVKIVGFIKNNESKSCLNKQTQQDLLQMTNQNPV